MELLNFASTSGFEHIKKCRQMRELVASNCIVVLPDIFQLLLNTAQLELKVKEVKGHLLVLNFMEISLI